MNLLHIRFSGFWNQNGCNSIYHKIQWYRVVLDEAHNIKAHRSQVSQAAFTLSAHSRWCLTGTPLQVCLFSFQANIICNQIIIARLKEHYSTWNLISIFPRSKYLLHLSPPFVKCHFHCRIAWRTYTVSCVSCVLNLGATGHGTKRMWF